MNFFRKKKSFSSTVILPRRNRPIRPRKRLRYPDVADSSFGWSSFYVFLWILFFGSLPALAFFSPLLRIQELSFSSNTPDIDAGVRERTRELLAQPASLLPGNTLPIALFNRKEIAEQLLREFPALRSIRIDLTFPDAANALLEFRREAFVLCSAGPCFLVDDSGVAYASAPERDGDISPLLRIVDQSGKPIELGGIVVSESFVAYVEQIRSRLQNDAGVMVSEEAITSSRLSNEIQLQTTEGWELRVNADIPIDQLILELRTLFAKAMTSDIRSSLVYLDLRASGKAFYLDRGNEGVRSETIETKNELGEIKTENKKKK